LLETENKMNQNVIEVFLFIISDIHV